MSNIKAYQSETVSQRFPSQNPPSCCTLGHLFTNGSFSILASSAMFVYINTKCSGFTDWMVWRVL